ncbi:MAG: rRNA (guanine-N1)-methyltransferase, partial [Gammaproteobacteria bacterium]
MIVFNCPHCRSALYHHDKQLRCAQGHAFDKGRAGDVNLLLPQQKRSKQPGDSKAMVAARRDFLASGVYQPLAESLAKTVTLLGQGQPKVIADAGCGEGYYLRQIQRLCYPHLDYFYQHGGEFIGWDISKYAVQAAAKQAKFKAHWCTVSNAAIPLPNNAVDLLICAFGFAVAPEFARILCMDNKGRTQTGGQGGYLITLDSGATHLIELRKIIYEKIKCYQEKNTLPGTLFRLLRQEVISYQVSLHQKQIIQLMCMTPHLY